MKQKKTMRRIILVPLLSLGALFPLGEALAQTGGYGGWHMGPGMMGSWGFGWFGGIFIILFWILILLGLIFLIRWLIQSTGRNKATGSGTDRALEILRERYARGEIDKEEFETKKKDLAR